jgi:hypothetical protein
VLYAGSSQTFYNATVAAITLLTPSGVFTGPATGSANTLTLPAGSIITLVSDGTNYIAQDWLGGPASYTSITASGTITAQSTVTFNPSNANISIQPTGTGTVTINPASTGSISNVTGSFTTLTANGAVTLTSAGTATSYNSAGAALLVSGGVGIAGALYTNSTAQHNGTLTISSGNIAVTSGTITAGDVGSTQGATIILGNYGSGAITTFGSEYSSGGPLLGYGVTPGQSGPGTFASSSPIALNRGAYTISGNQHNWYTGVSQTVSIGSSVAMTTSMVLNSAGLSIGSTASTVALDISSKTDAIVLPSGTTAQRPSSPRGGMLRYNSSTGYNEYYYPSTSTWVGIGQFSATSSGIISYPNSGLLNGYVVHVFTTSGSFTVNAGSKTVNYLIVGGGGGGGWDVGGGGGGGGLLQGTTTVAPGAYTVTVGGGGPTWTTASQVSSYENGGNSSFSAVGTTAIGGGGGGNWTGQPGSGGGSGGGNTSNLSGAASGTVGQGNNGGAGSGNTGNVNEYSGASGGGGAGSVGGPGVTSGWSANSATYGYGGAGLYISILAQLGYGSPAGWFAGGGGSGSDTGSFYGQGSNGGGSVGGNNRVNAPANTGGGGGGAGSASNVQGGLVNNQGSLGGSGIVIIWYTP